MNCGRCQVPWVCVAMKSCGHGLLSPDVTFYLAGGLLTATG
jgi:hypothetical protein